MRKLFLPLLVSGCLSWAGNTGSGKTKAATCTACHGADGLSANDLWPDLAGQKEQYLVKQLKAFRASLRPDPLMGPLAKMLTDQDIEDLAAYFASLRGS